jgi:lambda repressor-like predicted transcriptional regulator/cytochrome c553
MIRSVCTAFPVFGLVALALYAGDGPSAAPEFNRDIRPILAEHCFACHGPDSAARKADLRLDLREEAVAAGAIAAGKLDESQLIERIFASDDSKIMPPPKAHKPLKPEQKELLKRWIAAGAEYQAHWSLIAPKRPELPVLTQPGSPIRNPIDAFIVAELQKRGLSMAPEADRRTLARRLSLDMTGLPPDPERVEKLVADTSPNWYERYVDELMQSSHWGEHRARYWLDAARYADTHGIHIDNFREMWSYRDWVIGAFNRDLPFDQFTVEQIAGDMLPDATIEQKIATGFHRNAMTNEEGGVDPEESRYEVLVDRANTTATVWLGSTLACAQCHNHKYDPFTQKDYFRMLAFFQNGDYEVRVAGDGTQGNAQSTAARPRSVSVQRLERSSRPYLGGAPDHSNSRRSARKHGRRLHRASTTTPAAIFRAGTVPSRRFVLPLASGRIATSGRLKCMSIAGAITCSPPLKPKACAGGRKFWQPTAHAARSCPSAMGRLRPAIGNVWMEPFLRMRMTNPGSSSAMSGCRRRSGRLMR